MRNVAIVGRTGAIGNAVIERIRQTHPGVKIYGFSRREDPPLVKAVEHIRLDLLDEESISLAASRSCEPLDLVFVATGLLHSDTFSPEKSLRDVTPEALRHLFAVNAIGPALVAKYFVPLLHREKRSVFAALTARVGSIEDNRLGGWYSYRASKAALNMIIRNIGIEATRKNPQSIIVGLHPGTVKSPLSKPFQRNVPKGKLFSPEYSARKLLRVIDGLTPEQSGKTFAWDSEEIPG